MDFRKWWSLQGGMALNAARDKYLAVDMHHTPQFTRRRWRTVRSAAAALLRLAYGTAEGGARLTRRNIERDLGAIQHYGDLRWPSHGSPGGRSRFPEIALSADDFVLLRRELRNALGLLVLTERRGMPWEPPAAERVEARYYPHPPADVLIRRDVTPEWLDIVYDAASVIEAAMPWFRCCELCGRLFFKVKRQRLCGNPRCEAVFYTRKWYEREKRKGDETERRGRKRNDYAAVFEQAHGEWLYRAAGPPGVAAPKEQLIVGERRRPTRRRPASSSSATTARMRAKTDHEGENGQAHQ